MEGSHTCAKYLAYICTFLNVQSRCASMQQWKAQCKVQCNPGRIIWSSPPPDTQHTKHNQHTKHKQHTQYTHYSQHTQYDQYT